MADYPTREKFWAMKVIRLLTKTCVAQEIGPAGFALLSVIATTEDAAGYRRAVTYFDGQLAPIIGVGSQKVLSAARSKCVDMGWLHYEPGCKGRAAKYWVTIPAHADGIDDAPTDEGTEDSRRMRRQNDVESATKRHHNGDESTSNVLRKGQTFLPIPIPVPKETPTPFLENSNPNDPTYGGTYFTKPDERFQAWWAVLPEGMRAAESTCWQTWEAILLQIQNRHGLPRDLAIQRLIDRTQLFAKSPRGQQAKYRWSAIKFLTDGHYDDDQAAWELPADDKKIDSTPRVPKLKL